MAYHLTREFLREMLSKGLTPRQIAKNVGCSVSALYRNIKRLRVQLRDRDLAPGMTFDRLTVVRRQGSKSGDAQYLCRCTCGAEKLVRRTNLQQGGTRSCGCRRRGIRGSAFRGHGEIGSKYWTQIQDSARRRGLAFSITIQQAWQLFLKQQRRCYLTGLRITMRDYRVEQTASLDRVDPTQGYTRSNVRWAHKHVNRMKLDYTAAYFVKVCKLVAVHC